MLVGLPAPAVIGKTAHPVRDSLRQALKNLAAYALDFFLPRLCVFCEAPVEVTADTAVCGSCAEGIPAVTSPLCLRCGRLFPWRQGQDRTCHICRQEPPPFAKARAAVVYEEEGPTGQAVKRLKYGRRLEYLPVLQSWLRRPACLELASQAGVIIPVPLHAKRLRERGFNQALLLAQALPGVVLRDTLRRIRPTRPQTGLDPLARRGNVQGAFAVTRPWEVEGQNVLLVDDVYTTGATVQECARVLRAAGAREVNVLTAARTAPPGVAKAGFGGRGKVTPGP